MGVVCTFCISHSFLALSSVLVDLSSVSFSEYNTHSNLISTTLPHGRCCVCCFAGHFHLDQFHNHFQFLTVLMLLAVDRGFGVHVCRIVSCNLGQSVVLYYTGIQCNFFGSAIQLSAWLSTFFPVWDSSNLRMNLISPKVHLTRNNVTFVCSVCFLTQEDEVAIVQKRFVVYRKTYLLYILPKIKIAISSPILELIHPTWTKSASKKSCKLSNYHPYFMLNSKVSKHSKQLFTMLVFYRYYFLQEILWFFVQSRVTKNYRLRLIYFSPVSP